MTWTLSRAGGYREYQALTFSFLYRAFCRVLELSSLKELSAPKADQAKLTSAFNSMQQQLNQAKKLAGSVNNGNLGTAQTELQQFQSGTDQINQQLDGLGLTACGSGS